MSSLRTPGLVPLCGAFSGPLESRKSGAIVSRILVVEQEATLRGLLSRLIQDAGHEVCAVGTGTEGLAIAITGDFDLVMLELSLPDVAGEHVVGALIAVKPESRVMVVSGVTDVHRRVAVLDAGAIDFLAKPFANDELLARLRARIRADRPAHLSLAHSVSSAPAARNSPDSALPMSTAAQPQLVEPPQRPAWNESVQLDSHRRALIVKGRVIELSQREFVLMSHLLQRRGQICTRPELLADVWGVDFDPGTNVVDVYVRRLRAKLADNSIETIRNHGYRLVAS
ncbi:response regulator transcription factor [Jatrophihabitans telluris]|uniref:Response regulator transcription factor n=1 Tax=Jatrophihabitans telluris TaxID=2038343 RepID=A0ABY4QUN6_9ACTN|nr:response regulator transcription factor [Jatrophihabitans telluris]UQX87013.1 response regulator transcription factor [Jatrophihabitans telluris]